MSPLDPIKTESLTCPVRHIVDLGGSQWRLGRAPDDTSWARARWSELDEVSPWLPATVPGNIRADLLRAGQLRDWHFGQEAQQAHWPDEHCWWLVREWHVDRQVGQRVHLVLDGVDYLSDLFVNGRHLGRHEGMFSRQVHEIVPGTERMCLAVRIVGNRWLPRDRSTNLEKVWNRVEAVLSSLPERFPDRRDSLKSQMGFGWDFAPSLRPMGVWDRVRAVITGIVFIPDIEVDIDLADEQARVRVTVSLDAARSCRTRLVCSLEGQTFESRSDGVERWVDLPPGVTRVLLDITVRNPHLWWPWDQGQPELYLLRVEAWEQDRCSDSFAQSIGLRVVQWDGWVLWINGRRVFARGANWVPADLLPGLVTRSDYDEWLTLARRANMNMLRVWGGGLREKQAFYELCDEMGMLVWQDFPLACAFLTRYPSTAGYLNLVERETRSIVGALRNHPSVVLWCGGNEFDPHQNALLVDRMARVAGEDPSRGWVPASPSPGDSHNWQVWHGYEAPSAYHDDHSAFASEFGLQALPDVDSLQRFIPPGDLWPPGTSWRFHGADLPKLWRYARPFLTDGSPALADFVQASQEAQAHALQVAIEHYRRRKSQGGGGVLVWQLDDPWPAISWSLIDFYRRPKLAYHQVARLFAPLLISLEFPYLHYQPGDPFRARIWIIQDGPKDLQDVSLSIQLLADQRATGSKHTQPVSVGADSAMVVGELDWILPDARSWCLECALMAEGQVLASNAYDLGIYDGIQPPFLRRLRSWARRLLLGQ